MNAEQKLIFPDDVVSVIRTAHNERGVTEWQHVYPSCAISDRPPKYIEHRTPEPVYGDYLMDRS